MTGGGTLSIDTANVVIDADGDTSQPAGRHVRLRVSDTGAGMPAEIVDHIFEPFFTTKSEGSGTGLGLSTVSGIIAQAGGTITIQSQPGTGTTFTILLPVTDQVELPAEDAVPYQRIVAGETVLIVDGQDALREVTERIFTRSGYRVITAASGAEAVALAARHDEIHLLLTDVIMPNMLGNEVAEKVRALKPDIEVLFMSGYPQGVLTLQGRLGADVDLIEKPFTAAAITERAGRLLHEHGRRNPRD
jgi:CheY-like chemotaxis protein